MIKLEIYNGSKTYVTPGGPVYNPDIVYAKYPGAKIAPFVVTTDPSGTTMLGMSSLAVMRGTYNIDDNLTDDEAVAAIEEIMNAPAPEPEPSAEERIAAALELSNMLTMPDAEEEM